MSGLAEVAAGLITVMALGMSPIAVIAIFVSMGFALKDKRLTLFIAALCLMILEALITRMGWTLPAFATPGAPAKRRKKPRARRKSVKPASPHATPAEKPELKESVAKPSQPAPAPKKSEPDEEKTQRQSRFDRAKRRR